MNINLLVTPRGAAVLALSLLMPAFVAGTALGQSVPNSVRPILQSCPPKGGDAEALSPDTWGSQGLSAHCALHDPLLPDTSSSLLGLSPDVGVPEFLGGAAEDSPVIDSIIGSVRPLARHAMQDSLDGVLPSTGAGAAPGLVAPTAAPARDDIANTVHDWTRAWSARNAEAYLAHYSPDFSTGEPDFSMAQWRQQRRQRLLKPAWITVKAQDLRIELTDGNSAQVRFQQEYRSPAVNETTRKLLVLRRQGEAWRILSERAE